MPAGGTPPPQTRLQCPVAGANQRGRRADCAGCPRTDCSDGRICGGSGENTVAQPSVGPNPTRRQPVCAGTNANTDFSTKAVRIRRRGASVVVMPLRKKTASSRVSGLLRTQRRCRRAFSLPTVRIWARRTAQTRSSGIFLDFPAVFCYFWNATWRRNGWSEPSSRSRTRWPPLRICVYQLCLSADGQKRANGGVL